MKKIRLDVEAIAVESFETSGEQGEAGTVQAHMPLPRPRTGNAEDWTCDRFQWTCDCPDSHWQTYCGLPCGDTSPQYDTCWDTCQWP
jgi:hypothetical protein